MAKILLYVINKALTGPVQGTVCKSNMLLSQSEFKSACTERTPGKTVY